MDPQTVAGVSLFLTTTGVSVWAAHHADTPAEDWPAPLRWSARGFQEIKAVTVFLITGRVTPRARRVRRTAKPAPLRPGRPDYDHIFWLEIEDRTWRELNCPEESSPYAGGITHGGTGAVSQGAPAPRAIRLTGAAPTSARTIVLQGPGSNRIRAVCAHCPERILADASAWEHAVSAMDQHINEAHGERT